MGIRSLSVAALTALAMLATTEQASATQRVSLSPLTGGQVRHDVPDR